MVPGTFLTATGNPGFPFGFPSALCLHFQSLRRCSLSPETKELSARLRSAEQIPRQNRVRTDSPCLKAGGIEPLPPVSGPFWRFLSQFACRAPARLPSSEQKSLKNSSLTGARQFLRSSFSSRRGEHRRQYLPYYQGAQRRIGGNEPAETGRCSTPPALRKIH